MYKVVLSKKAVKDSKKIKNTGLKEKVEFLFSILKTNPYQNSPFCEKLQGNLMGFLSRRINIPIDWFMK